MTSYGEAPTLAQVMVRQGALAPDAVLLVLLDVSADVAAREDAGTRIGIITPDTVRLLHSGRALLQEAPGGGGVAATGAVVDLGGVFDAPQLKVVPALARLGVAMLLGESTVTSERAAVPPSVRGASMRGAFTRALERGLSGEVATAAAFMQLLREVPLRPGERKEATDLIARMATRAPALAPRTSGSVVRRYEPQPTGSPASAILRKTLIGALVLAAGVTWLERDRFLGPASPDDNSAVARALEQRSQRAEAAANPGSRSTAASVEDSTAIETSRLAGASRSGSSGGEAEASVANDPLIEGIRALEEGRTRDAIPLLKAATARSARRVAARGYLACAYRRLGQHDEADQALAGTRGTPGPWSGCARQRPDGPS